MDEKLLNSWMWNIISLKRKPDFPEPLQTSEPVVLLVSNSRRVQRWTQTVSSGTKGRNLFISWTRPEGDVESFSRSMFHHRPQSFCLFNETFLLLHLSFVFPPQVISERSSHPRVSFRRRRHVSHQQGPESSGFESRLQRETNDFITTEREQEAYERLGI